MIAIIGALLALFAGVAIAPLARRAPLSLAALDGFTLVTICGIVGLLLLPEALVEGGAWAAIAFAVGAVGPFLIGHRHDAAGVTVIAALGLAAHAFVDGGALALGGHALEASHHGHGHGGGESLIIAVLAHRLPVGLVIGGLMPKARLAWMAAGLVGLATIAGFVLGEHALGETGHEVMPILQALVAGGLTHVAFGHSIGALADRPPIRWAGAAGALVAFVGLVVLSTQHGVSKHCDIEQGALGAVTALLESLGPLLGAGGLLAYVCGGTSRAAREAVLGAASLAIAWAMLTPPIFLAGAVAAVLTVKLATQAPPTRYTGRFTWQLLAGLVVAGVLEAVVHESALELTGWWLLPVAALIGALTPLGAPGWALVAVILAHKGLPMPAIAALFSASFIQSFSLLQRLTLGTAVPVGLALCVGLFDTDWVGPQLHTPPPMGWWGFSGVAVLAAAVLIDLARFGPRRWGSRAQI